MEDTIKINKHFNEFFSETTKHVVEKDNQW